MAYLGPLSARNGPPRFDAGGGVCFSAGYRSVDDRRMRGRRSRHTGRRTPRRAWSGVLALAIALATVSFATIAVGAGPARAGTPVPGSAGCPMFPSDNIWNTDISSLPVQVHSPQWLASMNSSSTFLHPDFGPSGDPSNPYGMPFTVVPSGHAKVSVNFQYTSESDPGPYPFGPDTPIEGGQNATGDRHAIMIDLTTCTLYELYQAQYAPGNSTAGSGAIWNLRSNALRPAGWTSADAAGLPIMPGLLRYDEVLSGQITHAIRMTASTTDQSYLWPARHEAGARSDPNLPPMGARFRLNANFNIAGYSPQAQVVLRAMQHYGLILADNGSNWYFGGSADPAWPSSLVQELKTIPASAFAAVDESSLMVSPDSGQAGVLDAPGPGYRLVASDGGVFAFGDAGFYGSAGGLVLKAPVVGVADTASGNGYWLVASDGGVFSYGDARFLGSMGGKHLNAPIVAMAATPDGNGYWLVASDGGVFSFGDAGFHGSTGNIRLTKPVVGMAATPDGGGYWLVASDGGVFAFGDARFLGSMGAVRLRQPVVGMAANPGGGYWLVASDGGIFSFGAPFYGSAGALALSKPVVGMRLVPGGGGYWLAGADGGVFTFGAANFHGSTANDLLNAPVVALG